MTTTYGHSVSVGKEKDQHPCSFLGVALAAAPFVVYLYPAVAALLARSLYPSLLGRYSVFLAAFNAWNFFLFLLAIAAFRRSSYVLKQSCYISIVISTFLAVGNEQIRQLPGITVVLIFIRLFAAGAMIQLAFGRYRQTRRGHGPPLAVGTLFVTISIIDYILLASWAVQGKKVIVGDRAFRDPYDLTAVTDKDVLILGDSFVWGLPVSKEERFGNQLEALYRAEGQPVKVYSLGVIGANVHGYLDNLAKVPNGKNAGRVVLAFFMNDMPDRANLRNRIEHCFSVLGESCPSLRAAGIQISGYIGKGGAVYNEYVISCYDKSEGSYAERWEMLEQLLRAFKSLAAERSNRPPIFLIQPLTIDYQDYPLNEAHRDLDDLARKLGYETLDLLPIFRATLGDGSKHCPDECHYDALTHGLVARTLKKKLDSPP